MSTKLMMTHNIRILSRALDGSMKWRWGCNTRLHDPKTMKIKVLKYQEEMLWWMRQFVKEAVKLRSAVHFFQRQSMILMMLSCSISPLHMHSSVPKVIEYLCSPNIGHDYHCFEFLYPHSCLNRSSFWIRWDFVLILLMLWALFLIRDVPH